MSDKIAEKTAEIKKENKIVENIVAVLKSNKIDVSVSPIAFPENLGLSGGKLCFPEKKALYYLQLKYGLNYLFTENEFAKVIDGTYDSVDAYKEHSLLFGMQGSFFEDKKDVDKAGLKQPSFDNIVTIIKNGRFDLLNYFKLLGNISRERVDYNKYQLISIFFGYLDSRYPVSAMKLLYNNVNGIQFYSFVCKKMPFVLLINNHADGYYHLFSGTGILYPKEETEQLSMDAFYTLNKELKKGAWDTQSELIKYMKEEYDL